MLLTTICSHKIRIRETGGAWVKSTWSRNHHSWAWKADSPVNDTNITCYHLWPFLTFNVFYILYYLFNRKDGQTLEKVGPVMRGTDIINTLLSLPKHHFFKHLSPQMLSETWWLINNFKEQVKLTSCANKAPTSCIYKLWSFKHHPAAFVCSCGACSLLASLKPLGSQCLAQGHVSRVDTFQSLVLCFNRHDSVYPPGPLCHSKVFCHSCNLKSVKQEQISFHTLAFLTF